MERNNNGFTLVELVVVISILGVLIAILAPWYTSKIHKAKVATDWANVKSYYNEIQTDYMFTDKHNPKVPMKTGMCAVSFEESNGYSITYQCNARHSQCEFEVGVQKSDS